MVIFKVKKLIMKQLSLFTILLFSSLMAQNTISNVTFLETNEASKSLLLNPSEIKNDKYLNQLVVDLVEPFTVDSTFKRNNQRHRVYGLGALISVAGYKWRSIDNKREKVVGLLNKHYTRGHNEKAEFTEYDVNFDINPYIPKYIDLAYKGYQLQLNYKGNKRKKDITKPPYQYPTEDTDMRVFRFHNELTPHKDYWAALNTMFYPVHHGTSLATHPNFLDPNPAMGFYGVYVLDCNHSCHPEIHPYEWIWWLNTTEQRENTQSWWVGFFRENSNRFKKWSTSPRTGAISIPFAFPYESSDWNIHIEHQFLNGFNEAAFEELNLEAGYTFFNQLSNEFKFDLPALSDKNITVSSNYTLAYKGIDYWLENVNFDMNNKIVSGDINLGMSINDIYTAKISTSYK